MPSSFVGLIPIKFITFRQGPVEFGETVERALALGFLGLDLNGAIAGGDDVQFVAFLQAEPLDQRLGQPDGKAVTPFGYLHRSLHDIHLNLYIIYWISWPFKAA